MGHSRRVTIQVLIIYQRELISRAAPAHWTVLQYTGLHYDVLYSALHCTTMCTALHCTMHWSDQISQCWEETKLPVREIPTNRSKQPKLTDTPAVQQSGLLNSILGMFGCILIVRPKFVNLDLFCSVFLLLKVLFFEKTVHLWDVFAGDVTSECN